MRWFRPERAGSRPSAAEAVSSSLRMRPRSRRRRSDTAPPGASCSSRAGWPYRAGARTRETAGCCDGDRVVEALVNAHSALAQIVVGPGEQPPLGYSEERSLVRATAIRLGAPNPGVGVRLATEGNEGQSDWVTPPADQAPEHEAEGRPSERSRDAQRDHPTRRCRGTMLGAYHAVPRVYESPRDESDTAWKAGCRFSGSTRRPGVGRRPATGRQLEKVEHGGP